jgi:hypothetical protein
LLWLAQDRFGTKPYVLRQQELPEWYDKAVS